MFTVHDITSEEYYECDTLLEAQKKMKSLYAIQCDNGELIEIEIYIVIDSINNYK